MLIPNTFKPISLFNTSQISNKKTQLPEIPQNIQSRSAHYKNSSWLQRTSDAGSEGLVALGNWWKERKENPTAKIIAHVNNIGDSADYLDNASKSSKATAGFITKSLAKAGAVFNATTSVLDVAETYADETKANNTSYAKTMEKICKSIGQLALGGMATSGVSTAAAGIGGTLIGGAIAPAVIGIAAGAVTAYAVGKAYNYMSDAAPQAITTGASWIKSWF